MTDYKAAEKFILTKLKEEIPANLYYHGPHHTLDVLRASLRIAEAEKISEEQIHLLRIGALYHDSGFTKKYKNHEEEGCRIARKTLPRFGFSEKKIDIVCGLIMATKIPQSPKTKLEKVLCDADLDYLGRNDYKKISQSLFEELRIYSKLKGEADWQQIQINFLKNHHYHTPYSKEKREERKQRHLQNVIDMAAAASSR